MNRESEPIPIDLIGDVASAECFIGLRLIYAVVDQVPGLTVEVRWRPFQIDPELPPEGRELAAYLEEKGFSAEGLHETQAALAEMGREVGLNFVFEKIKRQPNTFEAHRLIRFARNFGVEIAMADALFEAFFLRGADIADRHVLSSIAAQTGVDAELARAFLDSSDEFEALEQELAEIRASGVDNVPRFIFAGKETITGVKSAEDFADALFNSIADE